MVKRAMNSEEIAAKIAEEIPVGFYLFVVEDSSGHVVELRGEGEKIYPVESKENFLDTIKTAVHLAQKMATKEDEEAKEKLLKELEDGNKNI